MISRITLLAVSSCVAFWSPPVLAAEYERSGDWVFHSKAFAEVGDETWVSCVAGTESADGTELALRLEPAQGGGVAAGMALTKDGWALGQDPLRMRLDIGADHWVLPGQGGGDAASVDWTGDVALLPFLEGLASSSFAGLIGRDGARLAQFSLKGSRRAIEAMKACVEGQIGQRLDVSLAAASNPGAGNPF